jgi:ribosome-associated protein
VTSSKKILRGKELAKLAASYAMRKKADYVSYVQLTDAAGIADWFVICQGDNAPHNKAIADAVVQGLKEKGVNPWHMEGEGDSRWILMDYSDVVVHVMLPDLRDYYGLEKLWPGDITVVHADKAHDD